MLIDEIYYYVCTDKNNNIFVYSRDTNELLIIAENMNNSDLYYKLTFVQSDSINHSHVVSLFIDKYFNNLSQENITHQFNDEYFVGILSTPMWFEFDYNKSLPFMQVLNILDDATVYGFEIKVENGKIYYQL